MATIDFELEKMTEHKNFIPVEAIMNDIPCLNEDSFQLWYLYKCYNKDFLNDDEIEKLDILVDNLKNKSIKVNKYNLNKLQVNDFSNNSTEQDNNNQ